MALTNGATEVREFLGGSISIRRKARSIAAVMVRDEQVLGSMLETEDGYLSLDTDPAVHITDRHKIEDEFRSIAQEWRDAKEVN